ncbi:hypothetical protein BB2000_1501 [Proteus mirabilis BB2000]|nr:hypothetical protein BB2000_1501 [Proteus mirabilis BB2000]
MILSFFLNMKSVDNADNHLLSISYVVFIGL